MDYIKSFFFWMAGILFLIIIFPVIICATFLFPIEKYDPLLKWACRTLLHLFFIRVELQGREHLKEGHAYLYICNHVNLFDIPIFAGYLPHIVRGVELDLHFEWPIYGAIIKRVGNIPISQKNVHSAQKSYDKAREALRNNISIVILPEGHRTRTGTLQPFARFPFKFAQQVNADIVPMALKDLFKIKKKGSWLIRPGTVTINIGQPISVDELSQYDSKELRDLIRNKIAALIGSENSH